MLILLPPSEGKTAPEAGPTLDLGRLSFCELTGVRERLLHTLMTFSARQPKAAATALGLGPTQSYEVARNAALTTAACAAASSVYTGVLFEALDPGSLRAGARQSFTKHVAIASALFGLVRPDDLIPAYRLSANTTLPKMPSLSSQWREPVSTVIARAGEPIFDLRSTAYVSLAPISPDVAEDAVFGRVLVERNGRRSVVSHHNKATKGRIVRSLLSARTMPTSVNGLLTALERSAYRIELHEPAKRHQPSRLDIIVDEL